MAKGKGEIQGWITKNGVHIPIYGHYTARGGQEPKVKGSKFKSGKKKPKDIYGKERTVNRKDLENALAEAKSKAKNATNENEWRQYENEAKEIQKALDGKGVDPLVATNYGKLSAEKKPSTSEKDRYVDRDWNKEMAEAVKLGFSKEAKKADAIEYDPNDENSFGPDTEIDGERLGDIMSKKTSQPDFSKMSYSEAGKYVAAHKAEYGLGKDDDAYLAAYEMKEGTWKGKTPEKSQEEAIKDWNAKAKNAKAKSVLEEKTQSQAAKEIAADFGGTEEDARDFIDKNYNSEATGKLTPKAEKNPDFSKMSYSEAGKHVAANKAQYGLKDSDDAYLAAAQMKDGTWKGAETVKENRDWAKNKSATGSTNTTETATPKASAKTQKVADNARKSLMFDKGYAEISPKQWSWAGMSNDKVVAAMNASDPKYNYEIKTESEKGNLFTNGANINHTRLYRTEKGASAGTASAPKATAAKTAATSGAKSVKSIVGGNARTAEWKLSKAYDKASLKEVALEAGVSQAKVNRMSTEDLREMLLAMWKKGK